jgi:DMSO/TMAO reductase YedYZ molybdopterin-dependent catalytic subunit
MTILVLDKAVLDLPGVVRGDAAIIDQLSRVVVVGGEDALELALARPDRVAGLVLRGDQSCQEAGLIAAMTRGRSDAPALARVGELRMPALVVGGDDPFADRLARRIPGAVRVRATTAEAIARAIAAHAARIVTAPPPSDGPLTFDELQLAGRNRGMPLEGLRYDITPVGMHYLLVHFDIPPIDIAMWRLAVAGRVAKPLSLSLADLQARPARTIAVTLECAGNGRARLSPRPISQPWLVEAIGTAEWTGTPLAPILAEAGVDRDAVELVFAGADRGIEKGYEHDYARSLSVVDATRDDVLLAYAMNGRPLEPQHGFPLRLIVPGWYGMTHVKWLSRIEAVDEPFAGYQQRIAYRYKARADEPGTAVDRIRPRALMIPPGIPDWLTRRRTLDRGEVELVGRAWSGHAPIARVEVGVDGTWSDARLARPVGPHAWRGWSCAWRAEPGEHRLSCRATDGAGNVQPLESPWNLQGMGNNAVQDVVVVVRD